MKKYLFLSLIFLSCFSAKAQPWSIQYAYVLGLTNSSITSSTVPITKTVDGAVRDTTLGLMNYLFSLITTANSLQAVTAVGNSTTIDMYSGTGTSASPGTGVQLKAGSALWLWNSGVNVGGLENFGGLPYLYLKDPNSSFQMNLIAGGLTANWAMISPNEGITPSLTDTGLVGTIMLHQSKDKIFVGSSGTIYAPNLGSIVATGAFQNYVGGQLTGQFTNFGSGALGGAITFRDATTGFYTNFNGGDNNHTATRFFNTLDRSGTLSNTDFDSARNYVRRDDSGLVVEAIDTPLFSNRMGTTILHNASNDIAYFGNTYSANIQTETGGSGGQISALVGDGTVNPLNISAKGVIQLPTIPLDATPMADSVLMYDDTMQIRKFPAKYFFTPRDSSGTSFTTNVTYNWDVYGGATISAQAGALNFVNPTGTLRNKQRFSIAIKDNGTPQTLTWGTAYVAASNVPLPPTTVTGFINYIQLVYSTIDSKIHITGYTY